MAEVNSISEWDDMTDQERDAVMRQSQLLNANQNVLFDPNSVVRPNELAQIPGYEFKAPTNFKEGVRNFAQNILLNPLKESLGIREPIEDVAARYMVQQRQGAIRAQQFEELRKTIDLAESVRIHQFFRDMTDEQAEAYGLSENQLKLARLAPEKAYAKLTEKLGVPTSYERVDMGDRIDFYVPGSNKAAFSQPKGLTADQAIDNEKAEEQVQRNLLKGKRERTTNMRKEWNDLTKMDLEAAQSYGRVKESAALGTAKGDVALLINFVKVLDPGSVVRESEFATVAGAVGMPEQFITFFKRAQDGQRMTGSARLEVVRAARRNLQPRIDGFNDQYERYQGIVQRSGLDENDILNNVFEDLGTFNSYELFSNEELAEIVNDENAIKNMSTKEFKELEAELEKRNKQGLQ